MRKPSLIALGALVALGVSTLAGVGSGSLDVGARSVGRVAPAHDGASSGPFIEMSARIRVPAVQITPRFTNHHKSVAALRRTPRHSRDLVAVHDINRPAGLRLSSVTGLPFLPRPKHKHHAHKSAPKPAVVSKAPVTPPTTTTTTTTVPPAAPTGGVWYELRMCESGDDYSINTGNGYYGAYQFALSTWLGLGFSGLPSDAPPAVQDRAAQELQARSGWGQWPTCSAKLGL